MSCRQAYNMCSKSYGQMLEENRNKKKDNRVCFNSRAEAEKAGYRRSRAGGTK